MKTLLCFVLLALVCSTAYAQAHAQQYVQRLDTIFVSEPGVSIFADGFESGDVTQWDASGDGGVDLPLRREDAEGNLQDLFVFDGRTHDLILEVLNVPVALNFGEIKFEFWGFTDLFGDGEPKALFYNSQDVRAYDLNPNALNPNALLWSWAETNSGEIRFLGAYDFLDNGFYVLILFLRDTKQVQIWGDPHASDGTARQ